MLLYVGFDDTERKRFKDLAGKIGFEVQCCYADEVGDEEDIVIRSDNAELYPSLVLLNIAGHPRIWPRWKNKLKPSETLRKLPVIGLGPDTTVAPDLFYRMGGASYVVQPTRPEEFEATAKTVADFWLGTAELPAPHLV